ncbi:MAG: N-acetyl-gamma-glutamyl-phosphate reductase [Synergistaceae bacterium]|jgi:N-acetyl-gamma-glutamyl-phosphate/LysW-gamma-L-alpha-aminoadipyl-6-phosphate reductase|nr:N-acetyl-gamma-glutamyl-phosphate reductase [Synergistaceae bacterium]
MFKAAVWGSNGMAGGEALRILAGHPDIELVAAVSRSRATQPVWTIHPHLRSDYPETTFISPEEALSVETDIAFLALPHGASWATIREYRKRGVKVADLSADVRLRDMTACKEWYGKDHPAPELMEEAVYGLPELHREELKRAFLASGVGCNATCAILGLVPLARAGLIADARMELRVGSSEAGAAPSQGGHHPYRDRTLRVYEPFRHRHLAEVVQECGLDASVFTMTMTAAPLVRGVQMLAQVRLSRKVKEPELWKAYRAATAGQPFWSLSPARPAHLRLPDPRLVLGSNRALTGFVLHEDGERLLVVSAIDNLMKGAAGTAVQCANLMLGLDETTGLTMRPVYPA